MSIKRVALILVLTLISRTWAAEDKTSALEKENAQLRQRIENLEKKVDELSKIVLQKVEVEKQVQPVKPAEPAQPKLSDEDIKKIAASIEQKGGKNVFSSLEVELYGMFKLDSSWDSSRMNTGNYADWVSNEASNGNDSEFSMTPKQTRFGLRVFGPPNDEFKTSGVAEIDFYGADSGENKAGILLRHAYLQLDWPKDRFSILAGQTSDLISPLYPSTINYTVGWWVGNIGYRRPQIRLTKIYSLGKDVDWTVSAALARTISSATTNFTTDTGEDSGRPGVQARTALKFPLINGKATEVGLSAHTAKEEMDTDTFGHNVHFDSHSLNLDLTQPINNWLTLKGEAFTGKNLGSYLGGIGQGVNTLTNEEIDSHGGWVAASLGPWDKWSFTIGGGVDTADRDDVPSVLAVPASGRTLNRNVFGNVIYSIDKNAKVGLELSHWRTRYKGPGDADSFRAQMAFMYNF